MRHSDLQCDLMNELFGQYLQCDQMNELFGQYLANERNENKPNSIKNSKVVQNVIKY